MEVLYIAVIALFAGYFILLFMVNGLVNRLTNVYEDLAKLAERLEEFSKVTGVTIAELRNDVNVLSALYVKKKK